MKRIILGISVLLILVQSGFAGEKEDAAFLALANEYKHQKSFTSSFTM